MKGRRIRTAGTLLTMFERTAVKSDSRHGTSRPKLFAMAMRSGVRSARSAPATTMKRPANRKKQRPVDLPIDPHRLDLAGEEEDRSADAGPLRPAATPAKKAIARPAQTTLAFTTCPPCMRPGFRCGLIALAVANSRAEREKDDHDDRDEAESGDRRQRRREGRIGDLRRRPDHHVLRIARDRRHAAAV